MLINPSIAEQMLAQSKGNRSESNKRVLAYAEMMKAGKWNYSNDAIVIDENGVLRNGHHRLRAIIKANVAIELWVCFNAPEDAWIFFDTNKTRGVSDMIEVEKGNKIKNSKTFAAVAKILCGYDKDKNNLVTAIDTTPRETVFKYAISHFDEIFGSMKIISHSKGLKCSAILAAFRILAIRAGHLEETVDYFIEQIHTGANLESGNPVLAFRNRYYYAQLSSVTDRVNILFLLIKVFNLYFKGVKISKLYAPNGSIDIETPQIKG